MSEKKDRKNITYRYCPSCGGKQIIVSLIKEKHIYRPLLSCYKCEKSYYLKEEEFYE